VVVVYLFKTSKFPSGPEVGGGHPGKLQHVKI